MFGSSSGVGAMAAKKNVGFVSRDVADRSQRGAAVRYMEQKHLRTRAKGRRWGSYVGKFLFRLRYSPTGKLSEDFSSARSHLGVRIQLQAGQENRQHGVRGYGWQWCTHVCARLLVAVLRHWSSPRQATRSRSTVTKRNIRSQAAAPLSHPCRSMPDLSFTETTVASRWEFFLQKT